MPEEQTKHKTFTELSGDGRTDVQDLRYLSNRFRDKALSWAKESEDTPTICAAANAYLEEFKKFVGKPYDPTDAPNAAKGIIMDAQESLAMAEEILTVCRNALNREPSPRLREEIFDSHNTSFEMTLDRG